MSTNEISLLVTDDDPHFHFFLKHGLGSCGIAYQLTTLKDGDQLIQTLSDPKAAHFDCILLDMNMPRKNGVDVLEELQQKKIGRGIPIIVMSQATDPLYVKEIITLGAAAYMEKPSGLEEFKIFAKKVADLASKK